MRIYTLITIGLLLLNNYAMSMEMVVAKKNKLREFDQAQVVASLKAETWKDYSFSSRLIIEIIKQKKLLSNIAPTEAEILIIKNMKRDKRLQYDQLVEQLRDVLSTPVSVNEVETLRAQQWDIDRSAVRIKKEELRDMKEEITWYQNYSNKHEYFWRREQHSCAHQLGALLFTECCMLLVFGLVDMVVCSASH